MADLTYLLLLPLLPIMVQVEAEEAVMVEAVVLDTFYSDCVPPQKCNKQSSYFVFTWLEGGLHTAIPASCVWGWCVCVEGFLWGEQRIWVLIP